MITKEELLTLLRQEVWMIIYRMYEYSNSQSSTQMPDGI